MATLNKISPCLWFDNQGEEAANFYVSVFSQKDGPSGRSGIRKVSRYGKEGHDIHGQTEGTVMTVEFELGGQVFTALNGGPHFQFNEAVSFVINSESQEETDYFWEKLSDGGEEQMCGWLKDKYGVSWQVIPVQLSEYIAGTDPEKSQKAVNAMLQMRKIDIAKLKDAYEGNKS